MQRAKKIDPKLLVRTGDIMFLIGVFLQVVAHAITNAAIWAMSTTAEIGATAQQIARAYEVNPFAISLVASTDAIALFISYIIQPALMLSVYYMIRRGFLQASPTIICFLGVMTFFMGVLNVANDAGNLLGLLIARGMI